MFEELTELILASALFVGGHVLMSAATVRGALRAKLGPALFQGIYSAIVAAALVWMSFAYVAAPATPLWDAPTAIRHLPLSLMLLLFITVAASFTAASPASIWARGPRLEDGPRGVFRISRHPLMWATGIWALLHLAATGSGRGIVFFGALAVLALLGPVLIEHRKARELGSQWTAYCAASAYIPFAAAFSGRTRIHWREIGWPPVLIGAVLYGLAMIAHEPLIGIAPASFVAGLFE
jgi:uncharacterized membrane protein